MENFKQMTKKVMSHYNLTEQTLADKLGVTQPTISRIKSGVSVTPDYHTVDKLRKLHEAIF